MYIPVLCIVHEPMRFAKIRVRTSLIHLPDRNKRIRYLEKWVEPEPSQSPENLICESFWTQTDGHLLNSNSNESETYYRGPCTALLYYIYNTHSTLNIVHCTLHIKVNESTLDPKQTDVQFRLLEFCTTSGAY